jgi:hypothetical protein
MVLECYGQAILASLEHSLLMLVVGIVAADGQP